MCNTPGLGGGEQSSNAQSGILRPAGSPREDLVQRNFISSLLGSDWTSGQGGLIGQLQGRMSAPTNYQTPQLTSTGLLQEQEAGLRQPFEQAVSQAMSRASGNFAGRGFLRPENIQAIAGSAAQNVAPGFANLMTTLAGQNVGQRTQAPLIMEDLQRQRILDFMNALGLTSNALSGSVNTSSGVQNSNWVGSAVGGASQGAAAAGAAAALGCLVAVELYGEHAVETMLARLWVHTVLPLYRGGAWLRAFYLRFGTQLAWTVRQSNLMRRVAQIVFDRMVLDMKARVHHG